MNVLQDTCVVCSTVLYMHIWLDLHVHEYLYFVYLTLSKLAESFHKYGKPMVWKTGMKVSHITVSFRCIVIH